MSKELNISLGTTGLTVTANVYLLGVAKATNIVCAEIGVTGVYAGDFTATPNVAGVYEVVFFASGATVSSGAGQIVWDGSAEVSQTGDNFTRIGAAGAGLTALGDTRIANLDATISSRTKPADTQARVTLVDTVTTYTGNTPQTGDSFARIGAGGAGLTAADDAVLAAVAALNNLSQANVRTAVGLATANLDTQLDALPTNAELATALGTADDATLAQVALVKAKTDLIPAAPAAVGNIPTALAIADQVWDEVLSGHLTAGSTGAALSAAGTHSTGIGAITWSYTLTNTVGAAPIADADVWVTTDAPGVNVIASGRTNASGVVTFYLDAGTIYVWRQKSGFNFTNPDTETVV